jgi:phage terminase large subunit-like protein
MDILEDQLTSWEPGMDSPDRLDAMVWGITAILDEKRGFAGGGEKVY